jgi:hypothetical protein
MKNKNLTDDQIDHLANSLLNCGEGVWGTMNDWSYESEKALWQRIAELAQDRANSYTE